MVAGDSCSLNRLRKNCAVPTTVLLRKKGKIRVYKPLFHPFFAVKDREAVINDSCAPLWAVNDRDQGY